MGLVEDEVCAVVALALPVLPVVVVVVWQGTMISGAGRLWGGV